MQEARGARRRVFGVSVCFVAVGEVSGMRIWGSCAGPLAIWGSHLMTRWSMPYLEVTVVVEPGWVATSRAEARCSV